MCCLCACGEGLQEGMKEEATAIGHHWDAVTDVSSGSSVAQLDPPPPRSAFHTLNHPLTSLPATCRLLLQVAGSTTESLATLSSLIERTTLLGRILVAMARVVRNQLVKRSLCIKKFLIITTLVDAPSSRTTI